MGMGKRFLDFPTSRGCTVDKWTLDKIWKQLEMDSGLLAMNRVKSKIDG